MPEIDLPASSAGPENARFPPFFSQQIVTGRRFFRPPGDRLPGIAVVSGGCEQVSADYRVHRKRFAYYGLEFVAAGTGTLELGRRRETLLPGTIFCYGPATEHDIRTDPANRLVKYFIDVTGTAAAALLRRCGLPPGAIVRTGSPAEVMALMDELIRNGMRSSPWSDRICRALFEAVMYKIGESAVALSKAAGLAFGTYQRCRETLIDQALSLESIQQLADHCGVDKTYLCRLFRRFDHESPYRKLMRLRMQEAAARLRRSPVTIKELAADFGFADQYHFSRAFKRVMGMPPSRLR
ncbi:MAG: AraC family transcriptional regulator [Phycisphaerae bacterium]|nr:AraC family transcriptional regulator [Phycisphaerae bacterium]MDW8261984.1 AraC family transcriptional regulator [Phycisphaerales bacterium]